MKKQIISVLLLSVLLCFNSCKKNGENSENTPSSEVAQESNSETTTSSEPKTFTVTATPETLLLGKNKEASVKLQNLKAVELSNSDGVITGIELSYEIELTNKNSISQGGYISLNPSKFRLILDNGNKISHENYNSVSTDPDETKTAIGNTFKLPAGTKPVSLNLFYDETIVNVKIDLK
jgi:hypothetical protein